VIYFESLKLCSFRNFDDEYVEFAPGTNVILGQNGHGKSNLLEAIYLICTGRSFRTSHIKELVGFQKQGFYLEAVVQKNHIKHHIKIELYPHKKKLSIDNTQYPHFHPLLGFLPVVIITPEMKKIIDDGPLERRKFLDFLASQISRPYFEAITTYHKAIKQKNAALKLQQSTDVWDVLLSKQWLIISKFRQDLISKLEMLSNKHLAKHKQLQATISLKYTSSIKPSQFFESPSDIMEFLKIHRHKEIHSQTSLYGPHREDIEIYLNHNLAATTASEGQKKMIIVALCLASLDIIKETTGTDPLMLIDDYDAHFDKARKTWVCDMLSQIKQSFLTSPLDELNSSEGTIYIEKGCFLDKLSSLIPL
jgi:DNA replication and repair protein RecF